MALTSSERDALPFFEDDGIIIKHAVHKEDSRAWSHFDHDAEKIVRASGIDAVPYRVRFVEWGGTAGYATGRENAEALLRVLQEYAPHDRFRIVRMQGFRTYNLGAVRPMPHVMEKTTYETFSLLTCRNCYATNGESDHDFRKFTSDCPGVMMRTWVENLVGFGIVDYIDTKWVQLKAVENPMSDLHRKMQLQLIADNRRKKRTV